MHLVKEIEFVGQRKLVSQLRLRDMRSPRCSQPVQPNNARQVRQLHQSKGDHVEVECQVSHFSVDYW